MAAAYIVDVVRTPRGIGKPGKGALAHLHPQQVGATVLRAIRDRNQLDTGSVDDVIWSTSMQSGKQGFDLGRMSALAAGYEVRASGATLSRFCGGGISAVSWAAASVMAGMEDCLIAGGTEMMSYQAAYSGEQNAAGINSFLLDAGNGALDGLHPQSHQGVCADAIASLERIERDALDALALESQRRAARAIAQGRFGGSLTAVLNEDGAVALDHEEFPRPDTTAEGLASLKPAFAAIADLDLGGGKTFRKQINRRYPDMEIRPVHHAGTSSGVVDGAAAVLVASAPYIERQGLRARARILAYANVGDCPTLMLNAPGPAARKVLAKAELNVKDIDVWEINEAFAVVVEKVIRDLDLDREKVNINGGAMALGHPIGATGAILIGTALDELERSGGRYGLVTMCAAGGMAPAIIIERLERG